VSAILAQAAEPAVPASVVPPWSHLPRPVSPHANVSRSCPSPTETYCATLFSSQAGSSSEQSSSRPWSLRATADQLPDVPQPVFNHKPTAGEPLVLPHLFPGQGRRRSCPILASRATLHAQGLHCVPFFLSRVLFVKQGPICNREKSSRGLPVKPNLK
jgi:hypothetical protein